MFTHVRLATPTANTGRSSLSSCKVLGSAFQTICIHSSFQTISIYIHRRFKRHTKNTCISIGSGFETRHIHPNPQTKCIYPKP